MIPKVIHYFWFSSEPLPDKLQLCLDSWKKVLPDYKIIKWDLNSFTIRTPYCEKALMEKKWAFLTDYARLWVLNKYGGIYMDADVLVVKSFDELLEHQSFWGSADNGMVEPVVIGSKANNPILQSCLDIYDAININDSTFTYIEIPKLILPVFTKLGYHSTKNEVQVLSNAVILPYEAFCPMPFQNADTNDFLKFKTPKTYAIHLWNANWFDPFRFFWNGRKKAGWKAIWKTIIQNPFQPLSFYKNVFYHLKCSIFGYPK